jgi:hypothetical protein
MAAAFYARIKVGRFLGSLVQEDLTGGTGRRPMEASFPARVKAGKPEFFNKSNTSRRS